MCFELSGHKCDDVKECDAILAHSWIRDSGAPLRNFCRIGTVCFAAVLDLKVWSSLGHSARTGLGDVVSSRSGLGDDSSAL